MSTHNDHFYSDEKDNNDFHTVSRGLGQECSKGTLNFLGIVDFLVKSLDPLFDLEFRGDRVKVGYESVWFVCDPLMDFLTF